MIQPSVRGDTSQKPAHWIHRDQLSYDFDVKMDFACKAHFVAGGHMTEAPSSITYTGVVAHDSVRLAFLIAALNGLDILACEMGNAYLNAHCCEKIWFLGGTEVGTEQQGKSW